MPWWLAACVPVPEPPTSASETPTETDGSTLTSWTAHSGGGWPDSGAGHSGAPEHTGAPHSGLGGDPCARPPPTRFVDSATLGQVPRSEEFAFDTAGHVFNALEGAGIYETTYAGQPRLVSPYQSWELAGARVTPDGLALAVADEAAGRIVAISLATGAQTVLAAGLPSPNSIGFDLRGWLYVGSYGQVTRYRGVGAPAEVLIDSPGMDFDGVSFAPDDSEVYANSDSTGDIWRIRLDPYGEFVDSSSLIQLQLLAEMDGMTTDTCGNLYIVETNGRLRRIRTDLTLETLIQPNGRYTTSISFGSGFGGFERDHLYMMDRNDGLLDLELGIEGRREPHYPL